MTKKLDPTLKPSNYKQLRKDACFPHESPNLYAVFKRGILKFCTHVLHVYPET